MQKYFHYLSYWRTTSGKLQTCMSTSLFLILWLLEDVDIIISLFHINIQIVTHVLTHSFRNTYTSSPSPPAPNIPVSLIFDRLRDTWKWKATFFSYNYVFDLTSCASLFLIRGTTWKIIGNVLRSGREKDNKRE